MTLSSGSRLGPYEVLAPIGAGETRADGQPVFEHSLPAGQAVVLRLSAPAARPRVVLFRLSRSFSPKRLGLSADRRELRLVAPE